MLPTVSHCLQPLGARSSVLGTGHPALVSSCTSAGPYVCRRFAFRQDLPSGSCVPGARTLLQTLRLSRDSLGQPGRNVGRGDGGNAPLEHPLVSPLPWVPSSGIGSPRHGLPPCLAVPGLLHAPLPQLSPAALGFSRQLSESAIDPFGER